jgi:tetratricopeptide (TPR) repeat protein
MYASWGSGLLSLRRGDLHRALPPLEQAVGMCQDADLPAVFPLIAAALGEAYTLAGRVIQTLPLLIQTVEQTLAQAMEGYQTLCRLPLGEAYLLTGRLDDAHTCTERALALARVHQERSNQAYALRLLGDIAARRDPPKSELAAALGMRPLQAHCHHSLETLYATTGQREQAHTELSTAVELYQAMEMTFWLPETEAALAQVAK